MGRISSRKVSGEWAANCAALGELHDASTVKDIRLTTLDSMVDVRQHTADYWDFTGHSRGRGMNEWVADVRSTILAGDHRAAEKALDSSAALIDAAITIDPRLARKPQWIRSDDGVFADAGLVASGDDSPCYDLRRRALRDAAASGDPINVVISTDSSTPTSLAALVAVIRLVQQFRPVHVWWQGGWLRQGTEAGYIFLAPVVQGDMDYSRLAFVVTSRLRDNASFCVLHQIGRVRDKIRINGLGAPAERAYLPGAQYVSRQGIIETPEHIAYTAAVWLGLTPESSMKYQREEDTTAALQSIPTPRREYKTPTEAEREESRRYWERYDADQAARRAAEAAKRLAAAGQA